MQDDISILTFDTGVPLQENDLVARLPSNLTSKAALFSELQTQLHFVRYFGPNWNYLHDWLRFPQDWASYSRVVLIHEDIPLFYPAWYEARTYLGIIIDSIHYLRTTQSSTVDSSQDPPSAIIAVFPPVLYEHVQALLERPEPWDASIGMRQEVGLSYLQREIDPQWDILSSWLERLDGLTVEYFKLDRDNRGSLTVVYLRHYAGYYVKYQNYYEGRLLLSSPIEHNIPTRMLTLSEVIPIVQYFYEHEQVPAFSQWYVPAIEENDLDELFIHWYYRDEYMEFVERPEEMVHTMIYEGMATAIAQEQKLLSIKDWQVLSNRQGIPHDQYLAALCVLGMENDPAISDRFLALLDSSYWKERWVSARFLGLRRDERAFPILVMMLTEELLQPFISPDGDWYYFWRQYAPKLLRAWQNPQVINILYQALQTWIAAESFFRENDNEFHWWMNFEASLCYELGYRDAFEQVLQLPLHSAHHPFLLISMAQGYYTKSHAISFLEESKYRYIGHRAVENDIAHILEKRCGFSNEQAQALLIAYREAFLESEIEF